MPLLCQCRCGLVVLVSSWQGVKLPLLTRGPGRGAGEAAFFLVSDRYRGSILNLHGMHALGTADAMVSRDASAPALISATFAREMQPTGDKSAYQVELQLRTIDGTFQDILRKS